MIIKRGDIVWTDLDPVVGSVQGKSRPCLVVQNNLGNHFSPTTIVAAVTSTPKKEYPFFVKVNHGEGNLPKDSIVMLNQLRTISIQHRISKIMGTVSPETMRKVDLALKASLALS